MLSEFHKRFIIFAGILLMFGNIIVLDLTFLAAFLNGNKLFVTVNTFNEFWVEVLALIVITFLGFYVTYNSYRNIPRLRRRLVKI